MYIQWWRLLKQSSSLGHAENKKKKRKIVEQIKNNQATLSTSLYLHQIHYSMYKPMEQVKGDVEMVKLTTFNSV